MKLFLCYKAVMTSQFSWQQLHNAPLHCTFDVVKEKQTRKTRGFLSLMLIY
jgi:hypothetical protein